MSTYSYHNYDRWLIEGKPSGFENYSTKKNFLLKNLKNLAKKVFDLIKNLFNRIPTEIRTQIISIILGIIIWRICNWLGPLIWQAIRGLFSFIFFNKTSVSPQISFEIPVQTTNDTSIKKIIFCETWSIVRAVLIGYILKKM